MGQRGNHTPLSFELPKMQYIVYSPLRPSLIAPSTAIGPVQDDVYKSSGHLPYYHALYNINPSFHADGLLTPFCGTMYSRSDFAFQAVFVSACSVY
jgi:hypothetical protein